MSNDSSRLPARAEALLAELPPLEVDWEAQARSIEERLLDVALGSTDAALLAAPLPQEPGEPEAPPSILSAPSKTEPSLADLARKVLPRSGRDEASQLYKESLSVAAAARANSDATFERVRSVPSPAAAPHVAAPRVSASASRADESAAPSDRAPSAGPPEQKPATAVGRSAAPVSPRARGAGGPFLAGVGVSLAAAAALALFFQSRRPTEAPVNLAERSASSAVNAPANAPSALPVERPKIEAPVQGVPLEALTAEVAERPAPAGSGPPESAAQALVPAASADGPRVANVPRSGAVPPAAGRAKVPLAGSADPSSTVVDPATAKLRPAAGASGGLADKPSTGAVQAALGSVMTSARRCLAGSATGASAVVVFGANGVVSNVDVTPGGASAACIKSALSQARVGPFAARSFSVKVPIRP